MPARSQNWLLLSENLVSSVAAEFPDPPEARKDPEKAHPGRKIYGGLCHSFPVMVRTCGLCQALAFSESKAAASGPPTPRNRAHQLLLDHVASVLAVPDAMSVARGQDTMAYMLATRQVLDAWIFFKRFAVSILKVEDASAAQDETATGDTDG